MGLLRRCHHERGTHTLLFWHRVRFPTFLLYLQSLLLLLPTTAVSATAASSPKVLSVARAKHNDDLPDAERAALNQLRSLLQPTQGRQEGTIDTELHRYKQELADVNYEKDPCTMTGVQCVDAHVSVVSLRKKGLMGEFPAPLRQLKASLVSLDLAHNSLYGTIPEWLGEFEALRKLNLGQNSFSGTLPGPVWSSLALLDTLILSDNNLVGSLPDSLGELSQLRMLGLAGNRFTGSIPESIGGLTSLQRARWRNSKERHLRHIPATEDDNGGLLCPVWTTTRLSVLKPGVDCRQRHIVDRLAQPDVISREDL